MERIKLLLGNRIKQLRKEKDITQEQLAELIDIDKRNLSNIENGKVFPSKTLGAIADALHISIADLFDYEHLNLNKEEKKQYITQTLDNLSEENITIIYRVIKSMR